MKYLALSLLMLCSVALAGTTVQLLPGYTKVVTATQAYSVTTADMTVLANATSGAFAVQLPTAVGIRGRTYTIKKIDSSANAVTIQPYGGQTIDGLSSQGLTTQYAWATVISDGSNWQIDKKSATAPTQQKFTVATSGTYTTPPGVLYIRVRMVGGGAGGGQWGEAATAPGNTTFGTNLLIATGGYSGQGSAGSGGGRLGIGGGGGYGTINSPAVGTTFRGGGGKNQSYINTSNGSSGSGGDSFLGGGPQSSGTCGSVNADANSGAGGTGGGGCTSCCGGGGGGAGGGVDAIIYNPSASYSYTVGAGGIANNANGGAYPSGGNGGSGIIIVDEYYR